MREPKNRPPKVGEDLLTGAVYPLPASHPYNLFYHILAHLKCEVKIMLVEVKMDHLGQLEQTKPTGMLPSHYIGLYSSEKENQHNNSNNLTFLSYQHWTRSTHSDEESWRDL